jgi:hypothetical protein
MIEGHSHLLLHPYNETVWNDQVLREPLALRVARAVNHARATLMAGITTVRDLGTEGAAYADVGLRQAINEGIIPGPRMLVAGPAMVVTGSYAPKGFAPEVTVPQGAEEADGLDGVVRVARGQIAHGVDLIKIYADYRWGPNGETRPGFTLEERSASSRPPTAAAALSSRTLDAGRHAPRDHGRRRHDRAWRRRHTRDLEADGGEESRVLSDCRCGDATAQYAGWKKGVDPEPAASRANARRSRRARCRREDVFRRRRGVFAHG